MAAIRLSDRIPAPVHNPHTGILFTAKGIYYTAAQLVGVPVG